MRIVAGFANFSSPEAKIMTVCPAALLRRHRRRGVVHFGGATDDDGRRFPSYSLADRRVYIPLPLLLPIGLRRLMNATNGALANNKNGVSNRCRCKIDLSSAETLQRDFYAWLNGVAQPSTSTAPATCTFAVAGPLADVSSAISHPSTKPIKVEASSLIATVQLSMAGVSSGIMKVEPVEEEDQKRPPAISVEQLPTSIADCLRRTSSMHHVKGQGRNVYGRPYCPGRPLSETERTAIVELHLQGMKVNAISKRLRISHGCVSKTIARFKGSDRSKSTVVCSPLPAKRSSKK